eukprot:13321084-Heterocapsa_arctica.AAC.1
MDAWGPAELKALPWQAIVELTDILNQIEKDGEWPEGLRGALVALLPNKRRHFPAPPKTHQSVALRLQTMGGG